MLAPLLMQPRASDITTTTMATNCNVWVEETLTTLATWEESDQDS